MAPAADRTGSRARWQAAPAVWDPGAEATDSACLGGAEAAAGGRRRAREEALRPRGLLGPLALALARARAAAAAAAARCRFGALGAVPLAEHLQPRRVLFVHQHARLGAADGVKRRRAACAAAADLRAAAARAQGAGVPFPLADVPDVDAQRIERVFERHLRYQLCASHVGPSPTSGGFHRAATGVAHGAHDNTRLDGRTHIAEPVVVRNFLHTVAELVHRTVAAVAQ